MISYLLETLVFQLVFLLVYDLLLKKETFFQWNRAYLLATYVLSLILPWIKIEALSTNMPQEFETTTVFLTQLNEVVLSPDTNGTSFPWPYWVLGAGILLASLWFGYKLYRLRRLKDNGKVERFPEFTKVTVRDSTQAFSFFRNIFLGAEIQKANAANIIAHELVHIKQWHSLDLLFFEFARILFWFNPLVYVYQNRISELHEFIADAKAVKNNKKEHFQMLLSEVFNTRNISFVNQFFNKSLIKKRIVMLQKKKSKAVWQLKYVLLLPLVLGILVYTSCEKDSNMKNDDSNNLSLEEKLTILNNEIERKDSLTMDEQEQIAKMAQKMISRLNKQAKIVNRWTDNAGIDMPETENVMVPFAYIEEVPIFPGCEDAEDKKACFREKIQEHIRKNFNYPQEAQEQGIQGRVAIMFTINKEGDIVDIQKKGASPILEAEAERIIEKLPKMKPGKQKGKVVGVPFSIPITFKLQ